MNNLNIAYACNDGYIMQTGISIISVFENNKHVENITIYLISCGINPNNISIIRNICDNYGRNLKLVQFFEIAYDLDISSIGRHIETIYAKIFFERISGVDKMLYIDSDTIVTDKLDGIWYANLNDCYMGMVQTPTGGEAKKQLGIQLDSPFYNDGMAIVNVTYCREHGLIEKCRQLIAEYDGNPPVLSEGCLNKVCQGHIFKLSPRYNMMAGVYQMIKRDPTYVVECLDYDLDDIMESFKHPVIIHFLAGFYNRPWSIHCTHPLKGEFYKYKAMSPWMDVPLTNAQLPLKLRAIGKLVDFFGPRFTAKIQKIVRFNIL